MNIDASAGGSFRLNSTLGATARQSPEERSNKSSNTTRAFISFATSAEKLRTPPTLISPAEKSFAFLVALISDAKIVDTRGDGHSFSIDGQLAAFHKLVDGVSTGGSRIV